MDRRSYQAGSMVRAGRLLARPGLVSPFLLSLALASAGGAEAGIFSNTADPATLAAKPGARSPVARSVPPAAPADEDAVPFARDPNDPMVLDSIFAEDGGADMSLSMVDREDWRPEHAVRPPAAKPVAAGSQTAETQAAETRVDKSRADKGADPEPEVTLPAPKPSTDPLDRPKPAVAPGTPATPANPAVTAGTSPEQPLSPVEAAIKTALDRQTAAPLKGPGLAEKRKERDAIAFFYAAHGFAPAWSESGKPVAAVEPVLARLARAGEDALKIPMPPAGLKADGSPDEVAAGDIALTEAVVAYARQATGSRVDPQAISPLIGAKRDLADPAEVIDALIAAGPQAGETLHALNPSEPRYAALRDQLAELHAGRAAPDRAAIPAGPTLHVGMHDPRVPALRARFGLGASDDGDDQLYDSAIAVAVSDFQSEHDLPATGNLTKRTVAALGGGGAARAPASEATIVANMEMWRWMPRDLGADRIEVNVPDFMVTVFHDGEPVAENRVVVGKTDTPTPLFSNTMKYLIVNPVWNVPQSIIKKELLPKGGGSLSYLEGRGYNVSYKHGEVSVQQISGAKNALGRIKFIFPNDYSVYLHDTPSKSLFSASTRAFSHGCVRVDQPFDFAESVLNDGVPEGGRVLWNQDRLEKMLGDKERYVNLPKPLPIHIEYFTASIDPETTRLRVRPDIYGYAHAVAAALGLATEPVVAADRKPRHVAERTQRAATIAVDTDPR